MHWGCPRARGDDVIGRDVNLASRIMDLAAPGEVLCSEATADQCRRDARRRVRAARPGVRAGDLRSGPARAGVHRLTAGRPIRLRPGRGSSPTVTGRAPRGRRPIADRHPGRALAHVDGSQRRGSSAGAVSGRRFGSATAMIQVPAPTTRGARPRTAPGHRTRGGSPRPPRAAGRFDPSSRGATTNTRTGGSRGTRSAGPHAGTSCGRAPGPTRRRSAGTRSRARCDRARGRPARVAEVRELGVADRARSPPWPCVTCGAICG